MNVTVFACVAGLVFKVCVCVCLESWGGDSKGFGAVDALSHKYI